MTKRVLIAFIVLLFVSLSMCLNVGEMKKSFTVNINGTSINVELRTNIYLAKKTELINTTPEEIHKYYLTKPNIYINGTLNITPEEGGVTIIDFISKVKWLNHYYPHNIVVELERNGSYIYVDSLTKDGERIKTYVPIENMTKIINSNKTMVVSIIKGDGKAKIIKRGNRFIIEGNSLEELDKAESRFIMAMLLGK
ncbi:conserved hypothetical protein [Methanocaldococcus infernus ME]|uniref:Uncharacterized protein n=1 Tax=Methanocaldococcus infernus (strain DSM 11812 / JCM 15783 / ME) TaxID=573063 RepID=D5VSU7_METIM|nr:hypothetical protein [Methanocaldococcus infernus]ADG13650.1 conserved hypothetical protein [Methanocaldococcus infernus ME]